MMEPSNMKTHRRESWSIQEQVYQLVLAHTLREYPHEACGILFKSNDGSRDITAAAPAENAAPEDRTRRYVLDPQEFVWAEQFAVDRQLDICGFYHSHPEHTCRPSEVDRQAAWQDYLYLIVAVRQGLFAGADAWVLNSTGEEFVPIDLCLSGLGG